jgi:HD-like signal output (HDOD) protein
VANSASLGFSRRVNTIKDAVILLGTRQTRDIAAAMATAELFKTDKAGHIDGTRLWNHALAVSWFSRAILEAKHIWQIDHVVTAGLLHDVGIVILCQHRPAIYSDVVKMTKENRLHHEVFEKQLLGVTHSQISGKACAKWRLPAPIVQLVNHHHNDPLIFRDTKAMLVLMVADYLSQELGFCNFEETPTRDRPEAAFRGLSINQDDEDKLRARSEELKEYTDALNEVL